MRLTMSGAAASALVVVFAASAQAQSISPAEFSGTMDVGESITIHKTITLGASGADLVDLFFLIDDTGSMGGIIGSAKAGATDLLNALSPLGDYNFGVASYDGDPWEGVSPAAAYNVHSGLTSSVGVTQTGINSIFAGGGGDGPEANLYALKRVADEGGWRAGSQRLVVWFGDAPGHVETYSQAVATSALNAAGVTVIGFNAGGAGSGIDGCDYHAPGCGGQASAIAAATGGSLTNGFSASTDFVTTVKDKISDVTTTLNLVFGSSYGGPGLSFEFTCTDEFGTPNPALCMDVGGGETRYFDVTITALAEGTYDFTIGADGVAARERDHIVVGAGGTVVPEPSTWLMLATGLLGLGFMGWRRKEEEGAA